jgi:hypothetical protein
VVIAGRQQVFSMFSQMTNDIGNFVRRKAHVHHHSKIMNQTFNSLFPALT